MRISQVSLSLIFIFFQIPSIAQTRYLEWVETTTNLRERIEIESRIKYKEDKNGGWSKAGLATVTPDLRNDRQTFTDNNSAFYLKDPNLIWFSINGSQRVYEWNKSNNSLDRIDKTYYSGFNFNATKFIRKDTLYSAGGYGYWHFHNFLTFYNKTEKEWGLIRFKGEAPEVILRGYQGYDSKSDLFFSGASDYETQKTEEIKRKFDKNVYSFDFKTSSWKKLGNINPILNHEEQRDILWTGSYFLTWAQNDFFIISPSDNKIYVHKSNKDNFQKDAKYYSKGDTLFIYSDLKSKIYTLSLKEILKNSKEVGAFYIVNTYKKYFILLFIVLLLAGLIGYVFKRKTLKRYSLHTLLSDEELILFDSICKLKDNQYLTAHDITDLLRLQSKSIENQRKIRMSFINRINEKIENKFNIINAIERKDEPTDNRIKLFYLNPDAKDLLMKLSKSTVG
jgi:hypothetical protein